MHQDPPTEKQLEAAARNRRLEDRGSARGKAARLSDELVDEIEWSGSALFRALSFWFIVEWNWEPLGRHARRILSGFEVAPETQHQPQSESSPLPRYRLARIDRGDEAWFWVLDERKPAFGLPSAGSLFDWFFWRLNADIVRGARDFFILHAGAVVAPSGHGVVLPGHSGAGKSSLVAGLVRRGFGYLSDEFAAIDPVERGLFAVPRALSLKPGSYDLFDGLRQPDPEDPFRGSQWHIPGSDLGDYGGAGPHRVRWVIAPQYQHGAPLSIAPMTPAETAYTLGTHSPSLGAYGRRALPLLADVASKAAGFRLISGNIEEAVTAVEDLVSMES